MNKGMAKLDELPEEIYQAIIESCDDVEERQKCTISLRVALLRSPVPRKWIYYQIVLYTPSSVLSLYRHIRKCGGATSKEAKWVQRFESRVWTADGQILADLLGLLPNLGSLSLNVGTTFAPEHLDDIFQRPRPELVSLELRFRPYVQTPTYYQFLKGAYFDSFVTHVSSWPPTSKIRHLVVIQEVPPTLNEHAFAQPIVFFSLNPFVCLPSAPSLQNLVSLTIRIPARPIADYLVKTLSPSSPPAPYQPVRLPHCLPRLKRLDLSTTALNKLSLSKLLALFGSLECLIVDDCGLIPRSGELEGGFAELGKLCATVGVGRAREAEKRVKQAASARRAAIDASVSRSSSPPPDVLDRERANGAPAPGPRPAKAKRGRKGLATAPFSLREKPQTPLPQPVAASGEDARSLDADKEAVGLLEKTRVLPSSHPLESLCLTTFVPPLPEQMAEWNADFLRGWQEGKRMVEAATRRVITSRINKLNRLFRFQTLREDGIRQLERRTENLQMDTRTVVERLPELVDLIEVRTEELDTVVISTEPPRLCFGGAEGVVHAEKCGHLRERDGDGSI